LRHANIEFGRHISIETRIAFVGLCVLLAFAALSALDYWKTMRAITSISTRLARAYAGQANSGIPPVINEKQDAAQTVRLKAAQAIIDRLRTPWPSLFLALEDSAKAEVAVLRIEPDAAHQEVHITADTSKMSGAVAYATNLQSTGVLTHVYVASQRDSSADPLHPVQVVIVGRWAAVHPNPSGQPLAPRLDGPAKW
jgi:hypothetical protein